MNEELAVNPKFVEGFNHGYLISKYVPEFATLLSSDKLPKSEFFDGFKAGRKTFNIEKTAEIFKDVSKPHDSPDKSKDIDKER